MKIMKTIRLLIILTVMHVSTIAEAQKPPQGQFNKTLLDQQLDVELGKVKLGIAEILNDKIEIIDIKNREDGILKDISVQDDRIEFKHARKFKIIKFDGLIDYNIENPAYRRARIVFSVGNFEFLASGWAKSNFDQLQKLRQNLIFMKKHQPKKRYSDHLILFEPIAAQYRALKVKPRILEERRKYVVQANAFSQQKQYDKAIELYLKALKLDETSYSSGFCNLALLAAQAHNFDGAIYNMKKYLMLEPDAPDASTCQDKIYEWEAQVKKYLFI
jgi:tetratricopeptide (TPR) repeat protein